MSFASFDIQCYLELTYVIAGFLSSFLVLNINAIQSGFWIQHLLILLPLILLYWLVVFHIPQLKQTDLIFAIR